MGTKTTPGSFDCYANAAPDEPMFVLLGRDPAAALMVLQWIAVRAGAEEGNDAVLEEAFVCMRALWAHAKKHASQGTDEDLKRTLARVQRFNRCLQTFADMEQVEISDVLELLEGPLGLDARLAIAAMREQHRMMAMMSQSAPG